MAIYVHLTVTYMYIILRLALSLVVLSGSFPSAQRNSVYVCKISVYIWFSVCVWLVRKGWLCTPHFQKSHLASPLLLKKLADLVWLLGRRETELVYVILERESLDYKEGDIWPASLEKVPLVTKGHALCLGKQGISSEGWTAASQNICIGFVSIQTWETSWFLNFWLSEPHFNICEGI